MVKFFTSQSAKWASRHRAAGSLVEKTFCRILSHSLQQLSVLFGGDSNVDVRAVNGLIRVECAHTLCSRDICKVRAVTKNAATLHGFLF